MPEGDSIWRLTRRLHARLAGEVVTASTFRVAQMATADLTGETLFEVRPYGKHLLMRFSNDITLHSHLRMDGTWQLSTRRRVPSRASYDVRAELHFDGVTALGIKLPVLELIRTGDEQSIIGHLGPDILSPEFDAEVAVERLLREPARPIAEALLDQRNLAGIGNLYKVEALFLTGVNPYTPAAQVRDVAHVVDMARRLMTLNLERGTQPTTSDRRRGESHWCYGRASRPCRRCRTPIAFQAAGSGPYDRETWWCPACQPASAQASEG